MGERPTLPAVALQEMDDSEQYTSIADEMRAWLDGDSSGHDESHAWRVFTLGTRIAREEGADPQVVGAAALTHDIHRAIGSPADPVDPADTVEKVESVLDSAGFPAAKVDSVCHCVAVHDEYEYRGIDRPAETVEAKILRDADNLDAMGAVGIARTFMFSGTAGHDMWRPEDEDYTALDHFDEKLLKLREEMHTDAAREMAADRHAFLESFVDRFEEEWYGEL
jgi:uncharacterized protein